MSAGDIVQRVIDNVELAGKEAPKSGAILRRVAAAHRRMAVELGIPTRYIQGVDATTAFNLPTEAWPGGLIHVEYEDTNRRVNTLTVADANDVGVEWDDGSLSDYAGHPQFGRHLVIYDPANITAPVWPLGFESGDTLRLLYTKKPTALTGMDVEPFDNQIPEYGDELLVQNVTFQILMGMGVEHAAAYYNDYKALKEDAFSYTRPMIYRPLQAEEVEPF